MSDYHPESWNPMWSVGTILTGLISFMLEDGASIGSIRTPDATRRKLAVNSHRFNRKDKIFVQLFPHLVVSEQENKARCSEVKRKQKEILNKSKEITGKLS